MIKLERSPSHSWWWDSHNSPRHSRWLQSNLKELDEKVKEMLKLIEEDADSFAQRAEMYYKKRPELLNLVEEFYRAYRSLAERYDHLTGEIRQNIPKAIQDQYGLSCDSPRAVYFGRHRHSPFRRDQQGLLKKFGLVRSEEQVLSENPEVLDNASSEHKENGNGLSPEEGLSSSSDSEVDNLTAVLRLQQELQNSEEENRKLADQYQKSLEKNVTLQTRVKELQEELAGLLEETTASESVVKELKEGFSTLQEESARQAEELLTREMFVKELEETLSSLRDGKEVTGEEFSEGLEQSNNLKREVDALKGESTKLREIVLDREAQVSTLEGEILKLQEENQRLAAEVKAAAKHGKTATTALRFLRAEVCSLVQRNKKLKGDISGKVDDETQKAKKEELLAEFNRKKKELHQQLTFLVEENRKQKLVTLDMAEEKREAIRQLCFSMDVLKDKNQRLEEALCSAKVRLHGLRNSASVYHLPTWKKVLLGAWNGPKPQPFALAL